MTDPRVTSFRAFLKAQGLDDEVDPQLAQTPQRVSELYDVLFSGLTEEAPNPSTFPTADGGGMADPVVVAAIPFYSMCVHHLLPFFGTVDVAYLPGDEMIGFGSVGRIVDHFSRRPQVQERLIAQIADHLESTLAPAGLLIRLRARQFCMEMRGAQKTGELISLAGRGDLRDGALRRELVDQFRSAERPL